jgi:hypothetical protein
VQKFNDFLDKVSDFLAHRKGLLPILGLLFVIINAVLQFLPGVNGLAESNILLHIGIIIAFLGFMLSWAL